MKIIEVLNKQHKFGEPDKYFVLKGDIEIETLNGETLNVKTDGLIFTKTSLRDAIERARKNPEDIPESFWGKLFG